MNMNEAIRRGKMQLENAFVHNDFTENTFIIP